MGLTKKPCPGCGEIVQREAEKVCWQCRKMLDEAEAAQTRQSREKDTEVVMLPWRYYSLPHISHAVGHGEPRHGDEIQKAIRGIAELLGKPAGFERGRSVSALVPGQEDYDYDGENTVRLPKGLRDLIERLYTAIMAATDYAYEEGCRDGNNLIVRLAKGEVSIEKFNKICADLDPPPPPKKPRRRK
jgi:hypothetical protein